MPSEEKEGEVNAQGMLTAANALSRGKSIIRQAPLYIRIFKAAKMIQPFSQPFIVVENQQETG